jgi:hypothetical protein
LVNRSGLFFLVLVCHVRLCAQDVVAPEEPVNYCNSNVCGQPRPKAFEIGYARVVDFGVRTRGTENDSLRFDGEVRRNRRLDIKLRVPLLNKPAWKLSLGFAYSAENYSFERVSGPGADLLKQLEDRPLRSISTTLYAARYFKHTFLITRSKASLDHDGIESPSRGKNPIKYTLAVVFGWKRSDNTAYGAGVAFSYLLGKGQVLPVLSFAHTFSPRFGIEALLPQSVRGRFNLGEKNLLYVTADVEGANYNILFDGGGLDGTYFLERSYLRAYARLEHELHDWLWCGVEAGLGHTLNLSLATDHGVDRGRTVINTHVNDALFFGASIFIVPPRKMMK